MAFEPAGRAFPDRVRVGDVANLDLATGLRGDLLQAIGAARQQHAVPAAPGKLVRERCPDSTRGAGDYGYTLLARHRSAPILATRSVANASRVPPHDGVIRFVGRSDKLVHAREAPPFTARHRATRPRGGSKLLPRS